MREFFERHGQAYVLRVASTFSRVSRSRWKLLVLIALAPAVNFLSPLLVALAAVVVLAAVAVENAIAWRVTPREPAPPSA